MLHALSLGFVLSILWLLLSGYFLPLILALGLASCVLVVYLSHRMDVIDREGHPAHLTWRAPMYWAWLVWEIVKANVDVARVILSPSLPIHPKVIRVTGSQKTELGHVIYANSITLTPGTVTIDLEDGRMKVHALTKDTADALKTGEMNRKVVDMEGAG